MTWGRGKIKIYYKNECKNCFNLKRKIYAKKYREQESVKLYQKNYIAKNRDKIRAQLSNYRKQNIEDYRKYDKDYYASNKDKEEFKLKRKLQRKKSYRKNKHKLSFKLAISKWRKEKYRNDPSFRIRIIVSNAISGYLKNNNLLKSGSIIKYVPFTVNELKNYLENQFEPWMNWANQGAYNSETWDDGDPTTWKWQIDHIIPHSRFKYTSMEDQSFKDCWALSNLRPYSAKQNVIDKDRNNIQAKR